MDSNDVRLFTASEAANLLHVSRNAIYTLWQKGLLDYWEINGTRCTNLIAVHDFLERNKNTDMRIET